MNRTQVQIICFIKTCGQKTEHSQVPQARTTFLSHTHIPMQSHGDETLRTESSRIRRLHDAVGEAVEAVASKPTTWTHGCQQMGTRKGCLLVILLAFCN